MTPTKLARPAYGARPLRIAPRGTWPRAAADQEPAPEAHGDDEPCEKGLAG